MKNSIFEHVQVKLPEDAKFKISPSQIATFFDYPIVWYRSEVLGEKQFKGNTAAVLGTTIHYVAEKYAEAISAKQPLCTKTLDTKIRKDLNELDNPEVDKEEVLSLYQMMSEELINQYLSSNIPNETEIELVTEIKNGIYLGGSCDAIQKTGDTCVITDYKSATTKPKTDKISWNHKIQTLAYAYVQKKKREYIQMLSEEECKKRYLSKHEI